MKYKVGDQVKIKSLGWYNANKDEYGYIDCGSREFSPKMSDLCGKIATIKEICKTNCYHLEEYDFDWTDEMIEGLVEEETLIERVDDKGLPFNEWLSHKGAFHIPDGYELKDENGNVINATKIVLEKKKKEYPKTYEECVHVLEGENRMSLEQMNTFRKLIDARNAYWKIAGEEMGLGKPWEPTNGNGEKVYSIVRCCGTIKKNSICDFSNCYILEFPTAEMRDAFYENFKELIEYVKELL